MREGSAGRRVGVGVLALIALALWPSASRAQPCACAASSPPPMAARESDAVFEGQVTGVREGTYESARGASPGRWVSLLVLREWKGATAGTTRQVFTPTGCAVGFETGTSWLVYARRAADNHELRTTRCQRTRRAAEAREDVAALGVPGTQIAVAAPEARRVVRRAPPARRVIRRVWRRRRRR